MDYYTFNGEIAQEYGVEEAVFLHNLYWWIRKNEANGRHCYDGRSWTYNSTKAFAKLFPFWTEKQIRRIVKKLENRGVLYVGNYNEKGFDRTQWYALDESIFQMYGTGGSCAQTGKCICPNGQMEVTKREDASAQTGRPIPDSKPDNKPDRKQYGDEAGGKAPTPPPKQLTEKQSFGEFGRVKLTVEEYNKLAQRLGKGQLAEYIVRLDGYLESSGKRYKSHYATILNWWRKDGGKDAIPGGDFDGTPGGENPWRRGSH